jgi:hypothetical protein
MRRIIGLVCLVFIASAVGVNGQKLSLKAIKGVWKVAEIATTGAGAGKVDAPRPGLMMFGERYYSIMYVPSDKERSPFVGDVVTEKEKADAFDSFFANAGTYELSGTTMTTTPLVAKNPGFEGGGFARFQVRVQGKELWLTSKNTDFSFRKNGSVVAAGGPASETTIKLVRVE